MGSSGVDVSLSGIPDIWTFINGLNPISGALRTPVTTANNYRWKVPERVDEIIDEMGALYPVILK